MSVFYKGYLNFTLAILVLIFLGAIAIDTQNVYLGILGGFASGINLATGFLNYFEDKKNEVRT